MTRLASILILLLLSPWVWAQYAQTMVVPQNVRWDDPRIIRHDGGTATVIGHNGKPYLVSCAHRGGYRGNYQVGMRTSTQCNTGETAPAVCVAVDPQNDCALWLLMTTYRAQPMKLAAASPRPGEQVRIKGFPMMQQLRDRYAMVIGQNDYGFELQGDSVQGESGAPIINSRDELCGVLFGGYTHGNGSWQTMCCGVEYVHRLVAQADSASTKLTQCTNCPNGICYPSNGWRPPQYVQSRPPAPQQPAGKPCDCGPKWDDVTKILEDVAANQSEQSKAHGELLALYQKIDQRITTIENRPAPPTVSQQQIQQQIQEGIKLYFEQNKPPTAEQIAEHVKVPAGPTAEQIAAKVDVPTPAEVAEEINKKRVPPRLRIVDPQGKFTTEYAEVRDGRDIDLIIDQRFFPNSAQ